MENKNTDLSKAVELTHQVTFSRETIVGLGWHIIQSADEAYYWHNGSTGGSGSFIMMDLNKKTAVIVLSNSNVETDTAGVRIFENL
ncbi:CubicO group peptidase (beta-lactamase class C family) [Pedobacter cryoconitis]|nr:CubicO group peptidase (beta-lactamase class C family) [Pedobacter cryoconitis]